MKLEDFKQAKIPVVEIFNSISGEGISAGEVVTFVRVAGCNLRCSYCDTTYSYNQSNLECELLTPIEIVTKVRELGCNKIICTGGEPLEANKAKRYLPLYLSSLGFNVRIETNGSCSVYSEQEIKQFTTKESISQLHYTLDIKVPSSGMSDYNLFIENFTKLDAEDELKFVVGKADDLTYALKVLKEYKDILAKRQVIINFSPVFNQMEAKELVDFLKDKEPYFSENKLKVRLSLQIHKLIWPPQARGV